MIGSSLPCLVLSVLLGSFGMHLGTPVPPPTESTLLYPTSTTPALPEATSTPVSLGPPGTDPRDWPSARGGLGPPPPLSAVGSSREERHHDPCSRAVSSDEESAVVVDVTPRASKRVRVCSEAELVDVPEVHQHTSLASKRRVLVDAWKDDGELGSMDAASTVDSEFHSPVGADVSPSSPPGEDAAGDPTSGEEDPTGTNTSAAGITIGSWLPGFMNACASGYAHVWNCWSRGSSSEDEGSRHASVGGHGQRTSRSWSEEDLSAGGLVTTVCPHQISEGVLRYQGAPPINEAATIDEADVEELEQTKKCLICMDKKPVGNFLQTPPCPCENGGNVCTECLLQWLEQAGNQKNAWNCTVCRKRCDEKGLWSLRSQRETPQNLRKKLLDHRQGNHDFEEILQAIDEGSPHHLRAALPLESSSEELRTDAIRYCLVAARGAVGDLPCVENRDVVVLSSNRWF